ncbi:MAG: aspartate ammonia-lyase [Clostridia bacterium]|nr:aspartate ammonia-lyase [Clostridia bacterium]
MVAYRVERDSIGEKKVPLNAYYGVQSLRGAENFPITGNKMHPELIRALAEIKKAAIITNCEIGLIPSEKAEAVKDACDEILQGKLMDQFIIDAIQGGAGTSANMNANEVISNRAIELLGGEKGDYSIVHPNDDVNCGQSTNDVYPSAGKLASIRLLRKTAEDVKALRDAFLSKAEEYRDDIKMGRTEMQDAVPIRFGQVFGAFASALTRDIRRMALAEKELSVLNMGATAVGTGINAHPDYIRGITANLRTVTGLELSQSEDLVDGTQNLDSLVYVSGILKSCAVSISKIASDIRLMSSGPRTGFGELIIPSKQNGSSIMPGKVNPVIPEMVNQVAFAVIGNDTTVALAAEAGQLELNAFEPVLFYRLFESLELLSAAAVTLRTECVEGMEVNRQRCTELVENSIGIVTALCPHIGYTLAASIAKKALKENRSVREVALEESGLSKEELSAFLDPKTMV